jgi:Fe-Mn family superoxide dismutase
MFTLPSLPYEPDALSPYMSAETLALHHGKHHRNYVDKLNQLIADTSFEGQSLEHIILSTGPDCEGNDRKIFNNAAQCWNHEFFWSSMTPQGSASPGQPLSMAIELAFENLEVFRTAFAEQATSHFGSGWAWLVAGDEGIEIMTTHDADLPLAHGKTALITCDLWEHAHYVDYRNERAAYVSAFLDHLIDWDFADRNYEESRLEPAAAGTPKPSTRFE